MIINSFTCYVLLLALRFFVNSAPELQHHILKETLEYDQPLFIWCSQALQTEQYCTTAVNRLFCVARTCSESCDAPLVHYGNK